jgi:UDP-2,3-diacylglucosamine pyrophosphatase LpxH
MYLAFTNNEPRDVTRNESNHLLLVSDLHIADGRTGPFGKYAQGENFFWDDAFVRFLEMSQNQAGGISTTLIINGDFLDFLRVDRIPDRASVEDQALAARWKRFLQAAGSKAADLDLFSVDKSERNYGLKTTDFKSVWKLLLMFEGHTRLFRGLRTFLKTGENKLFVLKGNHDLEFLWELVRQGFVYFLANEELKEYDAMNMRISFFQDSLVLNGTMYIEHGHRYEEITHAESDTLPHNKNELNLPVGSLFNRYVINKLEQIEPLFDNIKPPTKILQAVALHFPKKILSIVFYHLVGAWKLVRKYHVKFAAKIIGSLVLVGLPAIVFLAVGIVLYIKLQQDLPDQSMLKGLLSTVGASVLAFVVRVATKSILGGGEAHSFADQAKKIHASKPSLKLITMGHTHESEMSLVGEDCWYINSGTWIPSIKIDTNEVEDTNTFCVLRLRNESGELKREPLTRWNDAVGELEQMIVFRTIEDRKGVTKS